MIIACYLSENDETKFGQVGHEYVTLFIIYLLSTKAFSLPIQNSFLTLLNKKPRSGNVFAEQEGFFFSKK